VKETFGAKNRALFGVYDGHGHVGHETAIFARDNLPPSMKLTLEDFDRTQGKERSYDQALTDAHVATNEKLHKSPIDDAMSGTTSVTVLIDKSDLTIMNLGDSRAIIASELESMRASRASAGDIDASKSPEGGARSGNTRLVAKALSYDQTPYRKDERERCKVAGARIMTMDQVSFLSVHTSLPRTDLVQITRVAQTMHRPLNVCASLTVFPRFVAGCTGVAQIDGVEPLHENFNTSLGDELDEQGDPPRVWSKLGDYPGCAFTRSFGDTEGERVGVFAEPEITKHSLRVNDRLIVIASDGVFEFLTNQQVVNLIKEYPDDPLMACRKVVSEAYQVSLGARRPC
jgi:serine/threonine protein phosphatase PrpC